VTRTDEELSKLQLAWSRSSRLIVLQAAGGVVLLWCLIAFSAYRSRQDVIEARRAVMAQTATVLHEQASQVLILLRVSLKTADQWIARHPKSDPSRDPEFIQLVDGFKKASGGRVDIRMVTRDNKLAYAPYRADAAATDVSDREYVQAQKDPQRRGFHIGAPVLSRVTKKWGIPVTVPVSTEQGSIAILFGAIDLDTLFESHEGSALSSDINIAWIRSDGVVLGSRPFDTRFLGKSIAQFPDWVNQAKGRSGVYLTEHALRDDVARMVAYERLDEFPVLIAFSEPLDGILAPWKRQTLNLTVFALLVTVVIGVVTLRLIRAVHVAEKASLDLERVNDELQILSVTDKLTQVYNRVRLDEVLRAEMSRASRYGTPLSIALVDLDFFKQVNDVHGHAVGDEVLKRTAEILRGNIRSEDTVGRWGGEEFLIVFPQTEPEQALLVTEKIRSAIESDSVGIAGRRSASFGVTGYIPGDSEITILARADRALYAAKSRGRNLVVVDMARLATPGRTT
jgi:diguanylate cyclase (GGDEF)-like protein